MKPPKETINSAFSLLEVVVALALGAMLMGALVGVLKSTRQELAILESKFGANWQADAHRLLQRDLLMASRVSTGDGWFWLDGVFDDASARRIGYKCVPGFLGQKSVLMRLSDGQGEPALFGPTQILMERLDSAGRPHPLSATSTPAPAQVRVWIWDDTDEVQPVFVRDFTLH